MGERKVAFFCESIVMNVEDFELSQMRRLCERFGATICDAISCQVELGQLYAEWGFGDMLGAFVSNVVAG